MVVVYHGGDVDQVNNDQSHRSLSGCRIADSSDMAPGSRVNMEWRGMGSEYSPGMKMTNNNSSFATSMTATWHCVEQCSWHSFASYGEVFTVPP